MALPTTATLAYTTPLGGPVSDTTKRTLMAAVPLYNPNVVPCSTDPVVNGLFSSTVTSDSTAGSGGNMVRTIVITLGAGFFVLFPTSSDWPHAFDDLFGRALALALAAPVKSSAVVFA